MGNERADVENGTTRDVRPWTVMVYMAAGDSAELDDYAVSDLREMQKGANEHVHVAVQIKRNWPDTPQRYVISGNGRSSKTNLQSTAPPKDLDMGAGETLADFLKWALQECPARHYMLVLWGHAYGLGFGRDHGDPLVLPELVSALTTFRNKRNELDRKRRIGSPRQRANGQREGDDQARKGILEILGANACAMSYAEAAYELRNSANYLVASQIAVPFAGWPYDAVLESIWEKTEPKDLGSNIIDSYVTGLDNPLTGERVQMSLLDLSHAGGLRAAIDGLAKAIRGAFKGEGQFDSARQAAIRDAFLATPAGDVRPLIDLTDLSRALKRELCDPQLTQYIFAHSDMSPEKCRWLEKSAEHLGQQIDHLHTLFGSLILKASAHPSLGDLSGVGIYAPFVTDEEDWKRLGLDNDPFRSQGAETSRETYQELAIFSDKPSSATGNWPSLVYDDLNEPLPSELVDLIAGIGVTSSTDRAEIAQIILSIESTFNKLDRLLDTTQTVVNKVLSQAQPNAGNPSNKSGPPVLMTMLASHKEKAAPPVPLSEPVLLEWFRKLETALAEVERTTKKGLTQARFGLGPVGSPRGFDDEPVKTGEGAPLRDDHRGFDDEPVKTGEGAPGESTASVSTDVLKGAPEVLPAFQLFRRAADALRRLESATAELERQAGESLGKEIVERRSLGLRQAFVVLCETATSARRTIRRVIANPAYGLGPAPAAFDVDDREELANAAGLSARNLLLLGVDPLTPEPDEGELIIYEEAVKSARAHAGRVDAPVPGRR